MTSWGCSYTFPIQSSALYHVDRALGRGAYLPRATSLRAEVSIVLHKILLAELPRLPIVETDGVRFRAHERNTCANKHGDDKRNESIPHGENGIGG